MKKEAKTLMLAGACLTLFALFICAWSLDLPNRQMYMAQKMMLTIMFAGVFVAGSGLIIELNPPTATDALHEYADDVLAKKPVPPNENYGVDTDEPDMRTPEERERDIKEAEATLAGLTKEFDDMVAREKSEQEAALPKKPDNLVIPENDYQPKPPKPAPEEFKGNGVYTGKVSQTVFPILPDDNRNHEVGC